MGGIYCDVGLSFFFQSETNLRGIDNLELLSFTLFVLKSRLFGCQNLTLALCIKVGFHCGITQTRKRQRKKEKVALVYV